MTKELLDEAIRAGDAFISRYVFVVASARRTLQLEEELAVRDARVASLEAELKNALGKADAWKAEDAHHLKHAANLQQELDATKAELSAEREAAADMTFRFRTTSDAEMRLAELVRLARDACAAEYAKRRRTSNPFVFVPDSERSQLEASRVVAIDALAAALPAEEDVE